MRMRQRGWVAVLYLILATAFVAMGVWQVGKPPERLSEAEIAELREEYPVFPLAFPPMVDGRFPTLDELIVDVDFFVYGEVIEKYYNYRYTIRVIQDTEGFYEKGEEITIRNGIMFADYTVSFEEGMKIVYGAGVSKKDAKETGYIGVGTYYVTEDGYVLSAFPEEPKTMKWHRPYTGVKVEYLLRKLRKPRWR